MEPMKKNAIRAIIIDGCYNVSMMCCTGPVMQTFLNSLGFPNRWIYLSTTLIQIVNMVMILVCSRWADRGSVIRRSSGILIPQAILFLFYIPLCVFPSASALSFGFLVLVSLAQAVTTGLYTVCVYKLPYVVLDGTMFTLVVAVGGLVTGALSLISGLILTWLVGFFSYHQIMLGGCMAAGVLTMLASFLVRAQKPLIPPAGTAGVSRKVPIRTMLGQPVFYLLAPANLIRGFSLGVISVLSVIALELGFSEQTTTAIVSVQSAATLLMCCLFGILARRNNLRRFILVGSMVFLLMPLMLTSKTGMQFLIGCFAVYMGKATIDYAIPAVLRWMVSGEIAGIYQAWRMGLTNCGMMLGSMTAAMISSRSLLILSAVTMVMAGVNYYVVIRKFDSAAG